ncbi:unnamed protein product [Agarophyton chilense]
MPLNSLPPPSTPESLHMAMPPTMNSQPPLRTDALAAHRQSFQYPLSRPSPQLAAASPPSQHSSPGVCMYYDPLSHPTLPAAHSGIYPSPSDPPHPSLTTSTSWSAASASPSPITPHVMPQPHFVPYMPSAAPGPPYYLYPPMQPPYVPPTPYYAPPYAVSTHTSMHNHQQRLVHGAVADPRLTHMLHTTAMAQQQMPVQQSIPTRSQPLMPVPVYVNMPQLPYYSQPLTAKKRRLQWTPELHSKFLNAVKQYGIDDAVPKLLLRAMNVPGLTRENVASHLQKYRESLRKEKQTLESSSENVDTGDGRGGSQVPVEVVRDKGLQKSKKRDDLPNGLSSSHLAMLQSSDSSSSEQNACTQAKADVSNKDGRLPFSEPTLKKRRLSESPT